MTSVSESNLWDFTPVFNFISSLASDYDNDTWISYKKSSAIHPLPQTSDHKASLGNFDKIWNHLKQPIDVPPPAVPLLNTSTTQDPIAQENEVERLQVLARSKSVKSKDRRDVIYKILQTSLGKPKPKQGDIQDLSSTTVYSDDLSAFPVAKPQLSRLGAEAQQNAYTVAINKLRLLAKLNAQFTDERRYLSKLNALPLTTLSVDNNTHAGLHVFVDASNIMIGFQDALKTLRGLPLMAHLRRQPFSFHNLSLVMERGRPVAKRVLAGSDNSSAIQEARLIGYETNILERVKKAREITPRHERHGRKNGAATASGYSGQSGGSGSETTAAVRYEPEKQVEQAVDEILHLKILESVVDAKEPSTIVLATGDAAEGEYSPGFLRMVERALEKGWKVELVSFRQNRSSAYKRREFRQKWGKRFKTIELDDFVEELRGAEEWRF
ncbi:MAG: hypothetical protein Q9167_002370 [Letrouitia subvulpina]